MADGTHIEWTDATYNPVTGCSVVSPGCTNCYAMRLAGTRLAHHPSRAGLTIDTKAGPVWNGQVRLNEEWLTQPLGWKKPRRIFVCAHGDLFHESVPDVWIDRVFAVMALSPQHQFQVLTKRASRMRRYIDEVMADQNLKLNRFGITALWTGLRGPAGSLAAWPLPNVWLGVSAEDQVRADERIPDLLATPAAVRFVSAEPLLAPIDFRRVRPAPFPINALTGSWGVPSNDDAHYKQEPRLSWIIAGGESGASARPMHPDWARSIRDQCAAADVPFFFKQWGAYGAVYDRDSDDPDWRRCGTVLNTTPRGQWLNLAGGQGFHGERVVRMDNVGKKAAGRQLDGVEHNGYPQFEEQMD